MVSKRNVVLIVDDDETTCELLKIALETESTITPLSVSNAQEALQLAQVCKPDLFVIDYLLGPTNGIALYRTLRSLPGLEKTPVVFISASPTLASEELKLTTDAEFIEKPFDLGTLLDRIQSHFQA